MGVLASPGMLEEVLQERLALAWDFVLEVGARRLQNCYTADARDAAFVLLALTSSHEAKAPLSPQQESLAVKAEAAVKRGLSRTGLSPPPRGLSDQKLHTLFLTAYAKAAGRPELVSYCQDRLERMVFYPGPLPLWWDGEIGPGCETARRCAIRGAPRGSDARDLEQDGAVSAWGSAVGAVALAFEDDQKEYEHRVVSWQQRLQEPPQP